MLLWYNVSISLISVGFFFCIVCLKLVIFFFEYWISWKFNWLSIFSYVLYVLTVVCVRAGIGWSVLRIIWNDIFVFGYTSSVHTVLFEFCEKQLWKSCKRIGREEILTCPSPQDEPSAAGRYATQYPLAESKQKSWAHTRSSLKHADVPRSLLHWASSDSKVPGKARPNASSSWGALWRQLAVSPLKCLSLNKVFALAKKNGAHFRKWWKLCTLHGDHLKPRSVCLKSDIIYPSSQRHFSAPGPPR